MEGLQLGGSFPGLSQRPVRRPEGLFCRTHGRVRGCLMSSSETLAEMSGRALLSEVSKTVRPLESSVVYAPALRHKGLSVHQKGRPRMPPSRPRVSPSRMRVAVDVDEVLGRFLNSLNQFAHDEYGLSYDLSDYSVYEFAKIWNCSQDMSNEIVHNFFDSHHFANGILPIDGALHSLTRLKEYCDLVVVTSRQHVIEERTREWLHLHFPNIFQEIHFGNHWAKSGKSRPKSEICRDIGATVLIDDNPQYALECAAAGIHVLLYDWDNGYPWSKTEDGPEHHKIRRVRDWAEVEQHLAVLHTAR